MYLCVPHSCRLGECRPKVAPTLFLPPHARRVVPCSSCARHELNRVRWNDSTKQNKRQNLAVPPNCTCCAETPGRGDDEYEDDEGLPPPFHRFELGRQVMCWLWRWIWRWRWMLRTTGRRRRLTTHATRLGCRTRRSSTFAPAFAFAFACTWAWAEAAARCPLGRPDRRHRICRCPGDERLGGGRRLGRPESSRA